MWVEKAYIMLHPLILKHSKVYKPEQVIGLIYCENSKLDPKGSRFEPHVYELIKRAKQGLPTPALPGLRSGKIGEYIKNTMNIDELKALATSYGLGQIMGYNLVEEFGMTYKEMTNMSLERSLEVTIKRMERGARVAETYEQMLRWWNTGSINGKTHDPSYVDKAVKISNAYLQHVNSIQERLRKK